MRRTDLTPTTRLLPVLPEIKAQLWSRAPFPLRPWLAAMAGRMERYLPRDAFSWTLLVSFLAFGSGLILYGAEFAKLGIPLHLPDRFNRIPHQEMKLFLFESLVAFIVLPIAAWSAIRSRPPMTRWAKSPALQAIALLLVFLAARAWPDFRSNEVLVIRNSAFLWYLGFPLLLLLAPITKESLEAAGVFFLGIILALFSYSVVRSIVGDNVQPSLQWNAFIGVAPCFLFAGARLGRKAALACSLVIGAGLGISLSLEVQRTSFIALILAAAGAMAWYRKKEAQWRHMSLTLVLATALGFLLFNYGYLLGIGSMRGGLETRKNPFVKSELNKHGLEQFRWQMWGDAKGLALSHPLTGIGFRDQVVYRIYKGEGYLVPNDGSWTQSAPIAGPHNSYLNAFARIGIAAVLLLLLHLRAFALLWSRGYTASASLLYGGFFYALFNVGLEGIPRSFFLLLALAVAVKIEVSEVSKGSYALS